MNIKEQNREIFSVLLYFLLNLVSTKIFRLVLFRFILQIDHDLWPPSADSEFTARRLVKAESLYCVDYA